VPAPGTVLRIGELRVNPALDEIVVDGKTVKVEPRTMRLLVCLAEHPGEVMSVERLLDEVWKDVVVSPDSVYQAIATLRRLLGDDAKEPKYIANVLRRGYRLVAPVSPWCEQPAVPAEVVPASAEPPAASPLATIDFAAAVDQAASASSAVSTRPVGSTKRGLYALATISTVLLLAAGWYVVPRVMPAKREAPLQSVAAVASNLSRDKSVAVLPFQDLSDKKDQGYFSDGLSEALIDLLTGVPGLHVAARSSSFYFKQKPASLPDVARALGVGYVLQGSARTAGGSVRIEARLVRADDGLEVWTESYERPAADIFKIQDYIASNVARVLKVSSLGPRKSEPTASPEAYSLYLHAMALDHNGGAEDYAAATEDLERAVALDPRFALAWASLATVLIDDLGWHDSTDMLNPCGRAHTAVDEAVRLDSTLARVHVAKARVLTDCDRNTDAAEIELKRALEIEPDNPYNWRAYAWMAGAQRKPDKSLRLAQESVIRDPLDAWAYITLGEAQNGTAQFASAEGSFRRAVELDPNVKGVHAMHANSLLGLNRPAEALQEARLEIDEQFRLMTEPLALDALGRTAEAERKIDEFKSKYSGRDPMTPAEFYACRKDADQALIWMAKLTGPPEGDHPNRMACFKKIENDPRYQALLLKLSRSK
jgi:transcriptional activator of cad operon